MGTAVLRPQPLMVERFRIRATTTSFQRRRNLSAKRNLARSNNSVHSNNSFPRSDKCRSPEAKKLRVCNDSRRNDDDATSGGLVNGQVTLLKRGESLDSLVSKMNDAESEAMSSNQKPVDDTAVRGKKRIGSQSLEMIPNQICVPSPNVYAGSAFFSSPSPRSLPLPSFSNKKQPNEPASEESASRDLRRLLRLD